MNNKGRLELATSAIKSIRQIPIKQKNDAQMRLFQLTYDQLKPYCFDKVR